MPKTEPEFNTRSAEVKDALPDASLERPANLSVPQLTGGGDAAQGIGGRSWATSPSTSSNPPATRKRKRAIGVSLTPDEMEVIRGRAAEFALPVNTYIGAIILRGRLSVIRAANSAAARRLQVGRRAIVRQVTYDTHTYQVIADRAKAFRLKPGVYARLLVLRAPLAVED